MPQFSVACRNASGDAKETTIGASPIMKFFNGTMPANCAAADAGTHIATGTLPSDAYAATANGVKAKTGTWTVTGIAAAGAGTPANYFRQYANDGTTCHIQGKISTSVQLTTNALTAANGNVLNFAATTGVEVGMNVGGTGVATGTTVLAVSGTTVTLSHTSSAGVANGATITFAHDMVVENQSIANGQQVTVNTFQWTEPNA